MTKEAVGFVGLGLMGQGMAANIVGKGWPLCVIGHRNRAPVDDLIARGATEAATLADLARMSRVIVLCLPGAPEIEATIAALRPGLSAGTVIVDCSTSDPTVTTRLAADLAGVGVDYADAPLSRTPKEAWEGALDCMVGADKAVFDRVAPVIGAFAGKIVHIGAVGDGHRMKLLNNFLSLGYAAIYAEALAMATKVGISVDTFDSVIRGGRMDCGFYQTFMGYARDGDRNAHRFTLTNAFKDLRYVESMANAAPVASHVASAVKNSFGAAVAAGGTGPEDYIPHLVDFVARANGLAK
ncbi:MAG: NAD(P)-dependent oxidoreductase [Rhodobacterales bacterium]|nr:NAD(P)-dependent oxidoreductase [Rhodobacterales bacterium]NCT13213.1 NAD(P)-dependent oxidoreductase [Rhodobacterales bacterium]